MPAQLAMKAIVDATEVTACRFAKLGWREKRMPFLACAAKPTAGFFIVLFERARQIFNFDKLADKRRTGVMTVAVHEVGATRYKLARNP